MCARDLCASLPYLHHLRLCCCAHQHHYLPILHLEQSYDTTYLTLFMLNVRTNAISAFTFYSDVFNKWVIFVICPFGYTVQVSPELSPTVSHCIRGYHQQGLWQKIDAGDRIRFSNWTVAVNFFIFSQANLIYCRISALKLESKSKLKLKTGLRFILTCCLLTKAKCCQCLVR